MFYYSKGDAKKHTRKVNYSDKFEESYVVVLNIFVIQNNKYFPQILNLNFKKKTAFSCIKLCILCERIHNKYERLKKFINVQNNCIKKLPLVCKGLMAVTYNYNKWKLSICPLFFLMSGHCTKLKYCRYIAQDPKMCSVKCEVVWMRRSQCVANGLIHLCAMFSCSKQFQSLEGAKL